MQAVRVKLYRRMKKKKSASFSHCISSYVNTIRTKLLHAIVLVDSYSSVLVKKKSPHFVFLFRVLFARIFEESEIHIVTI